MPQTAHRWIVTTTLQTVLSLAVFAITSLTSVASGQTEKPLFAYVGTFSSPLRDTLPTQVDLPPGNGRGIHIFRVDRQTGALVAAGEYRSGVSPSHLAINAAGDRLYSANETDRVGTEKHGTVSSFAIDRDSGQLKLLNTVDSGGAGPTYVSLHPSGKHLLVANYFGGSVAVIPIANNGSLRAASDVKVDEGTIGPTSSKQAPVGSFAFSGHDRTHAHMIQSDPSGNFVVHVDLGLDQLYVWQFDPKSGKLVATENTITRLPPGDGPRHFCFHPNGRWFYSIQEEGSTIERFSYDPKTGRLQAEHRVSTLPPSYRGSNFCSEILISADGKFLYAGNRLHDSVGIFAIDENGDPKFLSYEWTRGNYPRSFEFDPTGRFFYSCNQRADNLAIFSVNRKTGTLSFTEKYVPVGNPSCIVFLDTSD